MRMASGMALAGLTTLSLVLGTSAAPAGADCAAADVYLTVSQQPNHYLVPFRTCIVSTPYPVIHEGESLRVSGRPSGSDDGAGFDIWVPLP